MDFRNSISGKLLTATNTFTGTWFQLNEYTCATIFLNADVAGTLSIQYSFDQSTIDISSDTTHTSGQTTLITVHKATYFRILYTNGASNQSTFQIQVIHRLSTPNSTTASSGALTGTQNVNVQNDFYLDVVRGSITGSSIVEVMGYNNATSTSWEVIQPEGGSLTAFLSSASTVRIKTGGNANDTSSGSGARSVTIYGLDENWDAASETLTTNGTSASSASTTTFIRVNYAVVASVGTYTGTNTGDITIETTSGTQLVIIEATQSKSFTTLYSIPRNYNAQILYIGHVEPKTSNHDIDFFVKQNADDFTVPYTAPYSIYSLRQVQGQMQTPFLSRKVISEKTDLWMRSKSISGTPTIYGRYSLLLYSTS